MHSLTVADLRGSRIHLVWIQLLFTIIAAGALVAEVVHLLLVVDGPWLRSPLGSTGYLATGLVFAPMILVEQVWRIPRVVLLWSVPIFWLATYGDVGFPMLWGLMAVASAAVSLWWFVRAGRSVPTGPSARPPGPDTLVGSRARLDPRRAWLWIAGGTALGVALFVGLQFGIGAFNQYEANSEQLTVKIAGIDEDSGEALVVIDGQQVPVVDPLRNRPGIGDEVTVWVGGSDVEYVDIVTDVKDFQFVVSMVVGLAAAAPLFGAARGLPTVVAASRRRSLVRHGAPASRVRVVGGPGGHEVLPVDGDWPRLRLADMAGLVPADDVQHFLEKYDEDEEPEDEDDDDHAGSDEDDDEGLPDDAGLADWADELRDIWLETLSDTMPIDSSDFEQTDQPVAEAHFGPNLQDPEPFVLLGAWGLDSSVALMRDTGQAWLAEIEEPSWVKEDLSAWSIRNFGWLRWVVHVAIAIPALWFVPWFIRYAVNESFWLMWVFVGLTVVVALMAPVALLFVGWLENGRSRHGMITYGALMDELVGPERFVSVAVGQQAVAVRLQGPEDAKAVFPEHVGHSLTPDQAAQQIRSWFVGARLGSRSGRRPAPAIIVGVILIVAWGVQLLPLLF